jgi:glutamate formiminotransferase/formiminotetrahydrofolate cyclodeaminase
VDQLIECVPNFSEGRNQNTLNAIRDAIESVDGVTLLHQDSGEAANRTVYTFAGNPEAVIDAAFEAAKVASELIDMSNQKGEHPRIGALDVCPFVPIKGITKEELLPLVEQFAKRLNEELFIPVFMYEESARTAERRNLSNHRLGSYEGLKEKMDTHRWASDYGATFNPKSGGTVCGVRNFLLAYNINLETKDLMLAKRIAYSLRESAWPKSLSYELEANNALKLKAVKAIAWYIEDFDKVQVSINLTNFQQTPLWKVYEACKGLATQFGTEVSGSELIGLIPLNALLDCGKFYHKNPEDATEKELIQSSIKGLGLSDISPFKAEDRVLEYQLEKRSV